MPSIPAEFTAKNDVLFLVLNRTMILRIQLGVGWKWNTALSGKFSHQSPGVIA